MRMRSLAQLALVAVGAGLVGSSGLAAEGASNVQVALGSQHMSGTEDVLPAFFVTADFAPQAWWVWPEMGFGGSMDPLYGGDQLEWNLGLAHHTYTGNWVLWVAGGYASVDLSFGANAGSASSAYARAGIGYMWGRVGWGFGLRYLAPADVDVLGGSYPVGYLQWETNLTMHIAH